MKALTAFTEPPPLWWQRHLYGRPHLYGVIEARPAGFAVAAFAITAMIVPLAVFKLRSRRLASLAAVSLLVSAAAAITFSGVPPTGPDLSHVSYLILIMFPAGLLIWLTAGSAIVLTGRQLISSRQRAKTAEPAKTTEPTEPTEVTETTEAEDAEETAAVQPGTARTRPAAFGALAAATALIVLASLLGLAQASGYSGIGLNPEQVAVAARQIERVLPRQRVIALSLTTDSRPDHYRVMMGLVWALIAQGYDPDISPLGHTRPIPQVAVLVTGSKVTVSVTPGPR